MERKTKTKHLKKKNEWPYMSQGDMINEIINKLGSITSATIRRWQEAGVISNIDIYNVGSRQNIAMCKLYICAECYAAYSFSFGKYKGYEYIKTNMAPKMTLATIAYIRNYAYYYLGEAGIREVDIPGRALIEKELGYKLPRLPKLEDMNLSFDKNFHKLIRDKMLPYYIGCVQTWRKFFVDGMIEFGKSESLVIPK